MDSLPPPPKRARTEGSPGDGAAARYSNASDVPPNAKTKACTKFFSTHGCPYGDGCYFLHYLPPGPNPFGLTAPRSITGQISMPEQPAVVGYKTKLCNKFSTPEGCRYGDKCHFAHGEADLRKFGTTVPLDPAAYQQQQYAQAYQQQYQQYNQQAYYGQEQLQYSEPTPPGISAAALFGENSTAKITIDGSLAGAIIGKGISSFYVMFVRWCWLCTGGQNAKQIYLLTGAKLSVKDHEDPMKKTVEMEGSFEQIKRARQLVQKLLVSVGPQKAQQGFGSHNYKTKLCDNYNQKDGFDDSQPVFSSVGA